MTQENLFVLCLFGVVAAVAYGFCLIFLRDQSSRIIERLRLDQPPPTSRSATVKGAVASVLTAVGEAAAKPFESKEGQQVPELRRKLASAGIYANSTIRLFIGAKVMLLLGGMAAGYTMGAALGGGMLGLSMGGLFGYVLPSLWLKWRTARHQLALEHALPDALDLMVVCVEAGLTIDAALERVGREISLPHPHLAREYAICHTEAQMGVPRGEALRNMAERSRSPALHSLSAMLIQAERFGTSLGQTLRVHAESLRLKRQYAAEEMAAKCAVKLVFPVALFIFPTVLMVLIGPAIIQMILTGFLRQ